MAERLPLTKPLKLPSALFIMAENSEDSAAEEVSTVKTSVIVILVWLVGINLLAFGMMFADKRRAKIKKQRIPEKTLFVTAALGGSIGAMAGMWAFRHKTKHKIFVYGMPAILAAQLLIVWVAVRGI